MSLRKILYNKTKIKEWESSKLEELFDLTQEQFFKLIRSGRPVAVTYTSFLNLNEEEKKDASKFTALNYVVENGNRNRYGILPKIKLQSKNGFPFLPIDRKKVVTYCEILPQNEGVNNGIIINRAEETLTFYGYRRPHPKSELAQIIEYEKQLELIDKALRINLKAKQLPGVWKAPTTGNAKLILEATLKSIFGEDYQKMMVEVSQIVAGDISGLAYLKFDTELIAENLLNAKQKILEDAFLLLGVGATSQKKTIESQAETMQAGSVSELLNQTTFDNIQEFLNKLTAKLGFPKMTLENNFILASELKEMENSQNESVTEKKEGE